MIRGISAFITAVIFSVTASGFDAGETVIVVDDAELEFNGQTVGKVWPGLDLKIEAIDGHRLWVSDGHPGWLDDVHVVELAKGLPVLNELIRKIPAKASLYAGRASVWKALEEYDNAIADCSEAIRLDHTNVLAYNNRGTVRTLKGEADHAIADFNEALRLDPKNVHALVGRGNAWNLKNCDKGIAKFNEVCRLGSKSAPASAQYGNASSPKNERDKALADINDTFRPGTTSNFVETLSIAAFRQNDPFRRRLDGWRLNARIDVMINVMKAIADYSQAIRLDPEFVTAYVSRGIAWEHLGEFEAAVGDFTYAILLDPSCAKAYERRGCARRWTRNSDGAIADLNEAIRLDPYLILAYFDRMRTWNLTEGYNQALSDSDDSTWLDSKLTPDHERSEKVRNRKSELVKAVADFEDLRLKNGHLFDWFYGNTWKDHCHYGKVAAEFNQVRQPVRTFQLAYYNCGSDRGSERQPQNADSDSEDASQQTFTDFTDDGQIDLSINRQCEMVIIDLLKAIGLDLTNPDCYDRLAWVQATSPDGELRDWRSAVANATKACELSAWNDARYVSTLAAAYAEAADWENAIKRQEQAIELASDEPSRQIGCQRLELYKAKQPYREDPNRDEF